MLGRCPSYLRTEICATSAMETGRLFDRIYVAVRDRNWGTVLPRLSNLKIERSADSFQITYDCQHQQGDIDFFWKVHDSRGNERQHSL